jgi:hypothetical protein
VGPSRLLVRLYFLGLSPGLTRGPAGARPLGDAGGGAPATSTAASTVTTRGQRDTRNDQRALDSCRPAIAANPVPNSMIRATVDTRQLSPVFSVMVDAATP